MCILIRTLKGGEDPGKTAFSFGSSFSLKKECVHLYAYLFRRSICAGMGMEKETKKRRKSGYFPFILLFPLQKDMCIFIHIYSCGIYVHTWGMKERSRNGEKECIYTPERYLPFGFPFPLKKRTCAYLFAHKMGSKTQEYVHTCGLKKEQEKTAGTCMHMRVHARTCAGMADEKAEEKNIFFLLFLSFLALQKADEGKKRGGKRKRKGK